MKRAAGIVTLLIAALLYACGSSDGDRSSPSPTGAAPTVAIAMSTDPPPPTPTAPASRSITISAVGDISLAREVVPRMEANGAAYPYELIEHLLSGDIIIGNLEGALTERGGPWPKGYNFRTPPEFASGLRDAGFDVLSLANNHAMDFGAVGLEDTLSALRDAGVLSIGAGVPYNDGEGSRGVAGRARVPLLMERNGLRVAFIGCVDTPTEGGGFAIRDWAATDTTAGLFICDAAPLQDTIAEARAGADFVVVVVHAGSEYINAPDATQRRIAETALGAGADAYIGHHAHVVQPVEQPGSQLVAWGLGNFIFDLDNVDLANIPEPRVSLVLNVTLTEGHGVTAFEAIPVVLDATEDRPRPATPAEAAVLESLIAP